MAPTMSDAAEMLWVVLANVSGGDWTKQTPDWQEAAARWRDSYFEALKSRAVEGDDDEPLHTGDDERLDCVTSIRASLEEIIDEKGKPKCDHCTDLLISALDSCEMLDSLIIATIKRERLAADLATRSRWWVPVTLAEGAVSAAPPGVEVQETKDV